jgi:hypothetical protein
MFHARVLLSHFCFTDSLTKLNPFPLSLRSQWVCVQRLGQCESAEVGVPLSGYDTMRKRNLQAKSLRRQRRQVRDRVDAKYRVGRQISRSAMANRRAKVHCCRLLSTELAGFYANQSFVYICSLQRNDWLVASVLQ